MLAQELLDQRLQGEEVLIPILWRQVPDGVGQLEEVFRVPAAGPGGAQDLARDVLERRGAQVVGVVAGADVQQHVEGLHRRVLGVEDHRGGPVASLLPEIQVGLHLSFPAGWQSVGDAPHAALGGESRLCAVLSALLLLSALFVRIPE